MKEYIMVFLAAMAVTGLLTPLAIKLAPKIGAMDVPKDARRVHTRAIPRFGGIAIYIGTVCAVLCFAEVTRQITGVLAGAGLIVALGIVDDIKGMPAKVKLAGQIVCAAVACAFGVRVTGVSDFLRLGQTGVFLFPEWLSVLITVLWIVGITNTINLIDGLDGLAAGVSCISCLSVAYTAILMGRPETAFVILAVAGSAAGFLLFNFYPAKIFMGDAGSMQLGFMLATVSLIGESPTKRTALFATIIPIIILALPIFDTAFAIVRRVANHRPIMEADKGHLHHRIMAMGFGQRRTVLSLYCISALMGVSGILWTGHQLFPAAVLFLIAVCLVVIFLGIGIVDKKIKPDADETKENKE